MIAFRRSPLLLPLSLSVPLGLLLLACQDDLLNVTGQDEVASITLRPNVATLRVGQSLRLNAFPQDARGEVLGDRTVTWSSSKPEVARVASGVVTGLQHGVAVITASAGERSAEAKVTVQLVVSRILLTPESPVIATGTAVQLRATARSPDGTPIEDRVFEWFSHQPRIASVHAGKVRGLRVGAADIVVLLDGQSASTTVMVVPNFGAQDSGEVLR